MKNNRRISIAIFIFIFVIFLVACESSSVESSDASDNQSQNNNASANKNDDASDADSTENASNTDNSNPNKKDNVNENDDTSKNVSVKEEEDPPTNNTEESLKEAYLNKLNNAKKESEELEATDSSTFALKKMENDRWDIWDELLNEIYGDLKGQLLPEEMDQLREEQRNWLKYRDDNALEASLKYKGGTQEHLEYVAVLANLTEERCYELVEKYIG